jgi:hypothetical protein
MDAFILLLLLYNKTKIKLRGLSPQVNYTDRATTACRLCGLVVRVSDYRSRGPWFDSQPY